MIYARALNQALDRIMADDARVVLLGEDIADPYGGAFKITRGLQTKYGHRVRTTPVSEAAIAGLAAGLALAGFRPVAEIMFGDFLTLAFDQVVNHMTKYQAMYADQVTCPVILRSPSGGYRGYGPTHSQSLEKHFLGVPHLQVVAASRFHEPEDILRRLLRQNDPALLVENKRLYGQHLAVFENGRWGDGWVHERLGKEGTCSLSLVPRSECTVTVVAYGDMANQAQTVIERLAMEEEIFAELVVPLYLSPLDVSVIEASVSVTNALVTLEEGTAGWSWGSHVAAEIQKRCFGQLRRPIEIVTSQSTVIPAARDRERAMLVQPADIKAAIRKAAG